MGSCSAWHASISRLVTHSPSTVQQEPVSRRQSTRWSQSRVGSKLPPTCLHLFWSILLSQVPSAWQQEPVITAQSVRSSQVSDSEKSPSQLACATLSRQPARLVQQDPLTGGSARQSVRSSQDWVSLKLPLLILHEIGRAHV